jgi:hypothetical protein
VVSLAVTLYGAEPEGKVTPVCAQAEDARRKNKASRVLRLRKGGAVRPEELGNEDRGQGGQCMIVFQEAAPRNLSRIALVTERVADREKGTYRSRRQKGGCLLIP